MIRYNIHDLVEVTVDPRVPAALREAIAFQIEHFRIGDGAPHTPHRIAVRPYDDWSQFKPQVFQAFHTCDGVDAKWFDHPDRRLAYQKDAAGYRVFADTPAFLINMLLQFIFVQHGITLVHAAAVVDEQDRVTLLPGPGGVGKTALLGSLVKHHGYRLLGDDIIGLREDGVCFSFPRSFVLKEYHRSVYPELFDELGLNQRKRRRSVIKRVANVLVDNMPGKGLARAILRGAGLLGAAQKALASPSTPPFLAAAPVQDVFGSDSVADSGQLDQVIFMERWTGPHFEQHRMPAASMMRRMVSIIHHEWADHMRSFWGLGSMELVDLPRYFRNVESICRIALANAPCHRVMIPTNATPDELLDHVLEDEEVQLRMAA